MNKKNQLYIQESLLQESFKQNCAKNEVFHYGILTEMFKNPFIRLIREFVYVY